MSTFNDFDGYIPSTLEELLERFKTETNLKFPNVDLLNYENSTYWATQYSSSQENMKNGNNLLTIEERFFTWLSDEQNKIKTSKISTNLGLTQALLPFSVDSQVQVYLSEPGVLRIYIDQLLGVDEQKLAQTILDSKSAGDFTQNDLGWTTTSPVPIQDDLNRINQGQNILGQIQTIYWSLAIKIRLYVKITAIRSNSYLQVYTDVTSIRQAFLEGMKKLDQYGLPFYSIGKDFEGEKYLSETTLTFASDFTFETSLDNTVYDAGVRISLPGQLFTVADNDITVIIEDSSLREKEEKE